MYVGIPYSKVSEEDIRELESLGFFEDEDNDGFMSYKFGSA